MSETKRLYWPDPDLGMLRPMTDADLERVFFWRNHPSIRSHMFTQHEITWEEHRAWWKSVRSSSEFASFIFEWECKPLGYVAFSEIATKASTATWGFYTAPDAPRGTGSLMSLAAMDMGFGPLGLRKINAEVLGRNTASQRLHESFGFVPRDLCRDHVLIGESPEDVHRLVLCSHDWAALRPAKMQSLTERLSQ